MSKDKYSAVWVSHTSISDFLKCPRAYYLNNVYKNPDTGNKIQLMSPPLALGSAVHQVVESLSTLPTEDRFKKSLIDRFNQVWNKFSGKRGGFFSDSSQQRYKQRGEEMLRSLMENPGPLAQLAVKISQDLPHYWLSEEDNIILCGKVDWLQYLPDEDAVHIIDFKTGRKKEDDRSLQLPIYYLLVANVQKRQVAKASYWYLSTDSEPEEQDLPDLETAHKQVLQIAKKIKLARQLEHFKCPQGDEGCPVCRPYERIIAGEGELVGTNDFGQDVFVFPDQGADQEEAVIL